MITKHFSRTDAINEAKRVYGVSFKDCVSIKHDGAFWTVTEQLYQIVNQQGKAQSPKYSYAVAQEVLQFKKDFDSSNTETLKKI